MDSSDLLSKSAGAAARLVGDNKYEQLLSNTAPFFVDELSKHLKPTDDMGLLFEVTPLVEGKKDLSGVLLVQKDRVVLAWMIGTFRSKFYSVALPMSDGGQIKQVGTVPKKWSQPEKLKLRLEGSPNSYEIEILNVGKMVSAIDLAREVVTGKLTLS